MITTYTDAELIARMKSDERREFLRSTNRIAQDHIIRKKLRDRARARILREQAKQASVAASEHAV